MDQRKNGNGVRYVLFTGAGGGLARACIKELLRKDPSAVVFAADIDRKKLEAHAEKPKLVPSVLIKNTTRKSTSSPSKTVRIFFFIDILLFVLIS